jgi:hypothetical protein
MSDKWFFFIHTKQIISYDFFSKTLKLNPTNISQVIDNKNKEIIKLTNIPVDVVDNLYTHRIEKELIYNKEWTSKEYGYLKCIIGINTTLLETYILKGKQIPSRSLLFKLIRKNSNKIVNRPLDKINFNENASIRVSNLSFQNKILEKLQELEINLKLNTDNNEYILKKNIKKYGNIFFDTKLERFFLDADSIQTKIEYIGNVLNIEKKCGRKFCLLKLIAIEKKKNIPENVNSSDEHYYSKASIIFTNDIHKWRDEIKKWTPELNYICIYNKSHFEKYTYLDLINVDIVIISYNFITNTYMSTFSEYLQNNQTITEAISTIKMESYRRTDLLLEQKTLLSILKWNRVILDNFDEYLDKDTISRIVLATNSNYRWLLCNFNDISDIKCIHKISNFIIKDFEFNNNILESNIYQHIINIKYKDIKHFLSKPRIFEKVIHIEEENINTSSQLLKYKKKYLPQNETDNFLSGQSKKFISSIDINNIDNCCICMLPIKDNNIGLLKCGHIFCYSCVHKQTKCPTCRRKLEEGDIVNLETKHSFSSENISNEYGNKVKYLLNHLAIYTKVIIYSEKKETVEIVSNLLEYMGYNVSTNLKKKYLSNNNIYFIYTFFDYYIQNWDNISKVIIWDLKLQNSDLDIFNERNIYRNLLGLDSNKKITIEYYK